MGKERRKSKRPAKIVIQHATRKVNSIRKGKERARRAVRQAARVQRRSAAAV